MSSSDILASMESLNGALGTKEKGSYCSGDVSDRKSYGHLGINETFMSQK